MKIWFDLSNSPHINMFAALIRVGAMASSGDHRALARLRLASLVSLALWFGTTLVGSVLPNAL